MANLTKIAAPLAVGGLSMFESPDAEAIMIGRMAKKFNTAALDVAEKMRKEGASPEEIWRGVKTYFNPVDKRVRQEIRDDVSTLSRQQLRTMAGNFLTGHNKGGVPLSDLLDHPELYINYPELKDLLVKKLTYNDTSRGLRGNYDPNNNIIGLDISRKPDQIQSTLLHEVQHKIQDMEGFSPGGNSSQFSPDISEAARAKYYETITKANTKTALYDDMHEEYMALPPGEAKRKAYAELRVLYDELKDIHKQFDAYKADIEKYKPYNHYRKLGGEGESRMIQNRFEDQIYDAFPLSKEGGLDTPVDELFRNAQDSPISHEMIARGMGPQISASAAATSGKYGPAAYGANAASGKVFDTLLNFPMKAMTGAAAGLIGGSEEGKRVFSQDPSETGDEVEKYIASKAGNSSMLNAIAKLSNTAISFL